ncbi:peroxidase-related enzyme [Sedimentitalea sp.]|uniref:carboxymuconolactone decarboxylase family protein n=1 Tax=Sedimentitalea sp. TaxID=2048915 RepID=UPI003296E525
MKKLFPSLPDNAGLSEVFQAFPDTIKPLLEYHDALLRSDSPLSVAQRELIAAYVSGLNACAFCFGAHVIMARAFGVSPKTIDALLDDPATAPVDPEMRPVLAYVAKLTTTPATMTEADARAVYDAGWSERALFDAIQTCALFNFMNRILEGTGVTGYPIDPDAITEDDLTARRTGTYGDWGRKIGVLD